MAKAVLLAGDRYHQAEHAFRGVGGALEGAGLSVEYTTDCRALDGDLLRDARLFALLRDGMEWPDGHEAPHRVWMEPRQEDAIAAFVEGGGGFLPLHNSGWAYPWRGPYRRVLGGYYQTHGPIVPYEVEVVDPGHPVTAGVERYEVVDEQHYLWFDLDRVRLLLKTRSCDGREGPGGWAHEVGRGRVVYLANGHTLDVLLHPMYQRLLGNAVRWLLQET